jgi:hypothetical protein
VGAYARPGGRADLAFCMTTQAITKSFPVATATPLWICLELARSAQGN